MFTADAVHHQQPLGQTCSNELWATAVVAFNTLPLSGSYHSITMNPATGAVAFRLLSAAGGVVVGWWSFQICSVHDIRHLHTHMKYKHCNKVV
jgi:hypothetical protein